MNQHSLYLDLLLPLINKKNARIKVHNNFFSPEKLSCMGNYDENLLQMIRRKEQFWSVSI